MDFQTKAVTLAHPQFVLASDLVRSLLLLLCFYISLSFGHLPSLLPLGLFLSIPPLLKNTTLGSLPIPFSPLALPRTRTHLDAISSHPFISFL
jgi:hypothetical protein